MTANANSPLVIENNTNNYISLLAPSTRERGIIFGDNLNPEDGGLLYNSSNTMLFQTNGNVTRMALTGTGNLGIGTTNPTHTLHLVYPSGQTTHGLVLENTFQSNLFWNIYGASTGDLLLFNVHGNVGIFNGTSGSYTAVSDKKFKKNIVSIDNVLEKVMKLKPLSYNFTTQKQAHERKFLGMIAQDVQAVFPEIVYEHKGKNDGTEDFLTLDYSSFGVIAIKAIQEQQQKINDQDKKIEELTKLVTELKQIQQANNNSIIKSTISDASLDQNIPNPFNKTTNIRYNLPQKFTNAQIVIIDKNGKTLKQVNVSGNGKGTVNLDAAALPAGTYNYSLIVDGRIISAKQMVLTK